MKKIATITLMLVGVLLLSACSGENNQNNSNQNNAPAPKADAKIILFFGKGCPHCENVEKHIKDNQLEEKINFDEKEVFMDKNNFKVMEEKAKACGITDTRNLGVPFLWDGEANKCYSGDKDIINFFQGKSSAGESDKQ